MSEKNWTENERERARAYSMRTKDTYNSGMSWWGSTSPTTPVSLLLLMLLSLRRLCSCLCVVTLRDDNSSSFSWFTQPPPQAARSSVMRWLVCKGREKEEENFPATHSNRGGKKWKLFSSPHLTPHCELSFLLSLSVAVPERSSHYHTLASVDSWVGIFNPTHRNFPRENVVFIFIRTLCIFMLSSRFRSSSARPTHFALLPAAALLFGIPFKCCEWNEESEEDNRGKVFIFLLTLPVLARILSIFPLYFST